MVTNSTYSKLSQAFPAPSSSVMISDAMFESASSGCKQSDLIGSLELNLHRSLDGLEAQWLDLEKRSNVSVYQRFAWIEACVNTYEPAENAEVMIVTAHRAGRLEVILPLVSRAGIVRQLRWIGGSHSNFNFPIIDNAFLNNMSDQDIAWFFRRVTKLIPGGGFLKLCCQPAVWQGQKNPMRALPHQVSTNDAFAMDLSQGFEGVLAAGNAKRKRKKFRSQTRAVEPLSGATLVRASNESEIKRILTTFHNQKSARLKKMGMWDVYGTIQSRNLFANLAQSSLESDQPLLALFALEVDGKIRAICGGGIVERHFSAYFTSFADDELAHISPGEMLLYMMVEKLSDEGIQSIDMGGGDERYKRSWCSQTIEMFDVFLPLSPTAIVPVWIKRRSVDLRRILRRNPEIWKFIKKARSGISAFRALF